MKKWLKQIVPAAWVQWYRKMKYRGHSPEAHFTSIYAENSWGDDGTAFYSGEGTTAPQVRAYIDYLTSFIAEHNIQSIVEIGAGDFKIMREVLEQQSCNYTGIDVVAPLIEHNQQQYANDQIRFIQLDAVDADLLPHGDLCIIRQVLQHLSNDQIAQILAKATNYKYLLITEHLPLHPEEINGDKVMNGAIRLQNKKRSGVYIDEAPYNLKSQEVLNIRLDDLDFYGDTTEAILRTSLVVNH